MSSPALASLTLAILDTMISRAEAACERYRRSAETNADRPGRGMRLRKWRKMEETLTRLRAEKARMAEGPPERPGASPGPGLCPGS
jgi:hypothetical protein